jgi:GNAT superfamily N-acetyltransferase
VEDGVVSLPVAFASPGDPAAAAAFAAQGLRANGPPNADPVDEALALGWAGSAEAPRARVSLWLVHDLSGAPGPSGLVGHYEALDAEAGVVLLNGACAELARLGARRVLGPMNGSTWRRYRLELPRQVGDPDVQPDGFASEPRNPARYSEDFSSAGFRAVARYESRYEPALRIDESGPSRARADARGIHVHALDPACFDATLREMHALSLEAFAENLFYAPLPLEAFMTLYAPYRERVVPNLVRLASDANGRLAGYLFGFPDPLALVDGRPTRTVCKTVAIAPHARGAGLGGLLLDEFRAASVAIGAHAVVHALMQVDNVSMRMSARHDSWLFKRYALFGWTP